MREFSPREKAIIENITSIKASDLYTFSRFLQNCIFTEESGSALFFIHEKKVALFFVKTIYTEGEHRRKLSEFLELLFLLEYLENERYIYLLQSNAAGTGLKAMHEGFDHLHQDPTTKDILLNQQGDKMTPSEAGFPFNKEGEKIFKGLSIEGDQPLYQILEAKLDAPFCCSEELRQYVKNGYKDVAQMRHEQSIKYTKVALGVAIITSVVSIILSTVGIICN